MTKKELSLLYSLEEEIKKNRRRLAELKSAGEIQSPALDSLPGGGGIEDRVARRATEIADLERRIEENLTRRIAEERRLRAYIEGVDDALMRLILQYRHIDLLRWRQVAESIGGGNTADSIRMMYKRFVFQ